MFFTDEKNRNNEYMRRWVFHSGMVTPVEPPPQEEQEKLKQITDIVRSVFPDEWTRLGKACIYVFSGEAEERASGEYLDGQCDTHNTVMPVIAIAQEILDGSSPEYTAMVFLHEVTHVAEDEGHTENFYDTLDALIDIFNKKTGMQLVNDYK